MFAAQFGKAKCVAIVLKAVLKVTDAPRLVNLMNATSARGERALGIAARHGHPNPHTTPNPNPKPQL